MSSIKMTSYKIKHVQDVELFYGNRRSVKMFLENYGVFADNIIVHLKAPLSKLLDLKGIGQRKIKVQKSLVVAIIHKKVLFFF